MNCTIVKNKALISCILRLGLCIGKNLYFSRHGSNSLIVRNPAFRSKKKMLCFRFHHKFSIGSVGRLFFFFFFFFFFFYYFSLENWDR